MKNEFVPYDIALAMKELGFDEVCYAAYTFKELITERYFSNSDFKNQGSHTITTPLYQQAFRWFEEKHLIPSHIKSSYHKWEKRVTHRYSHGDNKPIEVNAFVNYWECIIDYDSKKEAQDACLRKLIEIVNQNKDD